ncbi:MAG: ABC transporter ATP-binding protein, partial [Myxococcaceae bacterium]
MKLSSARGSSTNAIRRPPAQDIPSSKPSSPNVPQKPDARPSSPNAPNGPQKPDSKLSTPN